MIKVFPIIIFAWPLLALMLHLLLSKSKSLIRCVAQGSLVLIWLALTLLLLSLNCQPYVIFQGNWPAPFGIALVVDALSKVMLAIFALVVTCISFYSFHDKAVKSKQPIFFAGFWLIVLGITGALLTADIFNLYVWYEVMLASAFILLVSIDRPKTKSIFTYALLNTLGTLLMLLSIGLIYGALGTLNYADIAQQISSSSSIWNLPIFTLFIFSMGIKGAIFPLYFWLPKAYPDTSVSSTLLLSSLITKVIMVVLLRLFWLWPILHRSSVSSILLYLAWGSMFFGVLGAASQFQFKRILAFHIISQLGYVLLAIVLPLKMAIVAAVYFLIHNIFVKTNLFMVAGVLEQHKGTDCLKRLGSVLKEHKVLASTFFLAAFSLAGFPPLSGFWGKFLIIKSALLAHFYWSAFFAIIVSLLTLYSMIKIWNYVFCEPPENQEQIISKPFPFSFNLTVAITPLLLLSLFMGLYPDFLLELLKPIENQLSNPQQYIQWVLGVFS